MPFTLYGNFKKRQAQIAKIITDEGMYGTYLTSDAFKSYENGKGDGVSVFTAVNNDRVNTFVKKHGAAGRYCSI